MVIVIEVGAGEIAATRFAMSPLAETVSGLQQLGFGAAHDPIRPWLRSARAILRETDVAMPNSWELVFSGRPSFPEFLTPTPASLEPPLSDELETLRATSPSAVRASLHRVFGDDAPAVARRVSRRPRPQLELISAELEQAYELLVAPYWPTMRAVMLADIVGRTRQLAKTGLADVIGNLHPEVSWQDGRIIVDRPADRQVSLGERGLVLIPTILTDESVRIKLSTSTQIALRYPARGRAAVWSSVDTDSRDHPALIRLVGRAKARVLTQLQVPRTTPELAARLDVTASAVSQSLTILRDAGLVRSHRRGREALHELTLIGAQLVEGDSGR